MEPSSARELQLRLKGSELPRSPEAATCSFIQAVKEFVTNGNYNDADYRELKTCSEGLSFYCIGFDSDWSKVKVYSYMLLCDEIWTIPDSPGPKRKYCETAAERKARPVGYVVASLVVIIAFYICHPLLHFLQSLSGGFFAVGIIALGPFLFMVVFGAVVHWAARQYLVVKEFAGWPAHSSLLENVNRVRGEKSRLCVADEPDGLYRGRPSAMRFLSGCADYLSGDYLGVADSVSYGVAMSIGCSARMRVFKEGHCHWVGKNSTLIDWKPCPIPERLILPGITAESDVPDRVFEWLQQDGASSIGQIFSDCMIETLAVYGGEIIAYSEAGAIFAAERERTRMLLELMSTVAESLERFFGGESLPHAG